MLSIGRLANAQNPQYMVYGSPLSTTDVSPDAPFGTSSLGDGGPNPTGRVVGLAWEPPDTLYAATPRAGVWKSLDGGQNWHSSSAGLQFGIAANNPPGKTYLAFDGHNFIYPERLLYAAIDNDGRVTPQVGGLWISNDGARSWQRIDLAGSDPSCTPGSLGISTVMFLRLPGKLGFSPHIPLVMTACGLFTTSDSSMSSGWVLLKPGGTELPFGGGSLLATDTSGTIFACQGGSVWESLDQGNSWVATQAPPMGTGSCQALAADPLNGRDASRKVLETTTFATCPDQTKPPQAAPCNYEVSVVTFANDGNPSDDQRALLSFPGDPGHNCCGQTVLAAFARGASETDTPGLSYDVYASNAYRFWVLTNAGGEGAPFWRPVDQKEPVHGDAWAIASTTNYSPDTGDCRVWLANDGGVYMNFSSSADGCLPDGPYLLAEHGLHLLTSTSLSGISVPQVSCPSSIDPCPALYASSADNDTWALTPNSSIPGQWGPLGCSLGDSGSTFVTQVIDQVVSGREPEPGHLSLFFSLNSPPNPGTLGDCSSGDPHFDVSPPGNYFGGNEPPGNAGFAAVGDPITSTNYYIGVDAESPPLSGLTARARKSGSFDTGWQVVVSGIFACCDPNNGDQIAAVKAGLVGSTLVIYVLVRYDGGGFDANGHSFVGGHVYRGTLQVSELGTNFNMALHDVSGGNQNPHLEFAADLFVNPYDTNNVYVFDRGAGPAPSPNIKISFDAGQTWQASGQLTDIATQFGTFNMDCNVGVGLTVDPLANGCTLRNMYFDPDPDTQVAVLQPGGVALSHDRGRHWADLDVTHSGVGLQDIGDPQPLQIVTGAFYDDNVNPRTHHPSLYLGLGGAGVHRIDGPLDTLGAIDYIIGCPFCETLKLFDDTDHLILNLHRAPDGTFHAVQLLDLSGASKLRFHFEAGGNSSPEQTINLVNAGKTGGVISFHETCNQKKKHHAEDGDADDRLRCTKRGHRD
jgi:hypothetical protein